MSGEAKSPQIKGFQDKGSQAPVPRSPLEDDTEPGISQVDHATWRRELIDLAMNSEHNQTSDTFGY